MPIWLWVYLWGVIVTALGVLGSDECSKDGGLKNWNALVLVFLWFIMLPGYLVSQTLDR